MRAALNLLTHINARQTSVCHRKKRVKNIPDKRTHKKKNESQTKNYTVRRTTKNIYISSSGNNNINRMISSRILCSHRRGQGNTDSQRWWCGRGTGVFVCTALWLFWPKWICAPTSLKLDKLFRFWYQMCNAVTIIESRKKTSTTATGRRETELRERERERER